MTTPAAIQVGSPTWLPRTETVPVSAGNHCACTRSPMTSETTARVSDQPAQ